MTNTKVINFDMDGTIADLYGVDGWLSDLIAERVRPYAIAKPLVNMQALARVLNGLKRKGFTLNIISWTSKSGTTEYNAKVKEAKIKWLHRHLSSVEFDNIYVVPYGTPKHTIADGYLFDDEEPNRTAWGCQAFDVDNIIDTLKALGA